ncbi:hypothetical protein HDF24_25795 [Mucilaginibacter sp. X4EP1]|uniref:hypothetical protein n=1 Tax=Mucilaginibacter sp. X4EP1 TaxID=2723092 RepID=UPI002168F7CB|nr:hypothetical protein [Mucilaginibacter sp. X4EP1]MCS3816372.1 hypothetical protein [Mucilaginibacter sp. X4EP1]
MKSIVLTTTLVIACLLSACEYKPKPDNPIVGTWQLLSHTETTKGVSTVTDYTKDLRMIKIINETHFAFLVHKLNTPKDSTNSFDGGGGTYTLDGHNYTEHLDYCIAKVWEGHKFDFKIHFRGDTLIQKGLEKLDKENINRIIIEKYVRVK